MIRQNLAVLGFETTGKSLLEITADVNSWVRQKRNADGHAYPVLPA